MEVVKAALRDAILDLNGALYILLLRKLDFLVRTVPLRRHKPLQHALFLAAGDGSARLK